MTLLAATHATPAGAFTVVAGDDGAVLAAGFTDQVAAVAAKVGTGAYAAPLARCPSVGAASDAVLAWAEGDLDAPLAVPVAAPATAWQRAVWAALRRIPGGSPWTYARLAREAGRPTAVRAAARGCATNPAALFVPCHRVVPASGGVGGFFWGAEVKRAVLDHEAAAR